MDFVLVVIFLKIVFLGLLAGFLLASILVEMAVSEKSAINC